MARLERRRRIRCRLPCEVVVDGRRTLKATVLSLSEGGLGLEAGLRVDVGEPIRLRILPQRGARAVSVDAIVWNDRPGPRTRSGGRLRSVGCVVSDPPATFLDLMAQQARGQPESSRATAARPARVARAPASEVDLPRSRIPLRPPKPQGDESLPRFRLRLKQTGGPRTKISTVRACSMVQAAEHARAALPGNWEVLEVTQLDGAA